MPRKANLRMAFTKPAIQALEAPTDGSRLYVHDARVPGLCLLVTAAGAKSFYIYKWMQNRPTRIRLGSFPDLSVEQARKAEGRKWIWVYHPPPRGASVAWNGKRDLGDKFLREWIGRFKPFLILGGHIHDAPYYAEGGWIDLLEDTFVLNGGRQPGGVPTFTIIELDQNEATWVSAAESERAMLTRPLVRESLG